MPTTQIPIGQLLVLRDGFSSIANNKNESLVVRRRATLTLAAIEELIERREREGAANA